MDEFAPNMNAAFREYADLQLRRHQLLLEAKDDSPEMTAAEERMEEIWTELDDVQRRSLSGMASDLNWIRRNCELPPKGRRIAEEVGEAERHELTAALKSKDWHRVLHSLRVCAPALEPSEMARERAHAYAEVGLPSYANVFQEKAVDLQAAGAGVAVPGRS